ncbi:protein of unknown function DUF4219 - like 10 [Theobroma cacao]|nr:protein of unknown function DUF4219 - like 10 [Theobroma cacao]
MEIQKVEGKGENHVIWAVKMKAYLRAFDLWEMVEVGGDPPVMSHANPTIAQLKQHSEEVVRRYKALSCIQSAVLDVIFTRIMTCDNPKEAWDRLKDKFHGSERTR